ncbi:serine protease 27 [Ictalurus furcatus]|uniref:serine protease 27 n=1 Tax=Ictalurus furcatus TaxID=66913 RepID=UPI002350526A|nr:serine protease 27 [Ictalurus furcatus]
MLHITRMRSFGVEVLVAVLASGVWLMPSCDAQECGRPLVVTRIVGGSEARDGAWPWQVDIQMGKAGHVCGGSVISRDWVLSAAHCFPELSMWSHPQQQVMRTPTRSRASGRIGQVRRAEGVRIAGISGVACVAPQRERTQTISPSDVSSYRLYMGRYQLNGANQFETSREVKRVVVAHGYSTPQKGRDVALVELSSPLTWTNQIQPVCLPNADFQFYAGTMCYVTGWGDTQEGVSLSGVGTLREVGVPIIDQDSCNSMYQIDASNADTVSILSDMICAGYQEGGKDSCQGDSGGPLVCSTGNGTWIQAGIVSFGLGCAQKNRPGVYARVSSFVGLIRSTVQDAQLLDHACNCAAHSLVVLSVALVAVMLGR